MRLELILGLVIIGVAISFSVILPSNGQPEPQTAISPELLSELKNVTDTSIDNPDRAYLMIISNTTWSATIMDSGNDFTTIDGSKMRTLDFECVQEPLSTYSISVQKQTESGFLILELIQNGPIIDRGLTAAEYGIVSLTGECGKTD